ncbi:sodium transporter HKT1-like [Rhododendron vialii]|uniref:sodium transporter HKT1-like n=1 Tax=Rhododendron vialii TaxID=182163 RepID=UPI002660278D|nr:sodium transporter HKT1-like [Rhododendron vialii]
MSNLVHLAHKIKPLFNSCCSKLASLSHHPFYSLSKLANKVKPFFNSSCTIFCSFFSYFCARISRLNPFWFQLHYFVVLSVVGFLALKCSKPKTAPAFSPKDLDLFFTSVSATTVSSMATIEMEVFSNTQLVILTFLMFVGGEVFTSFLGLLFKASKSNTGEENRVVSANPDSENSHTQIELGLFLNNPQILDENPNTSLESGIKSFGNVYLKHNSIRFLGHVVLCYLLIFHLGGSTLISLYILLVPSARQVLKQKGLQVQIFSVFTTVATFTNCGFIPTNENMAVFNKNSGLLLLLIPLLLFGNTLYGLCLRLVIWVLEMVTKREEFGYLLKNYGELGYDHLLSSMNCLCLAATVFGFILVQFVLFCSLEWNSEALSGLNSYQKLVGSLFQVVNSRHAGEIVVNLSLLSPAILVVFIVMMYLPPRTSFFPTREEKSTKTNNKKFVDYLLFSKLSYLAIFITLICITERDKLKEDPLNFNVLNITLETISAYGNVGFSTGYSCKRRVKYDSYCEDKWFGLVGRWSDKGKLVLIVVMFFGRLKNFGNEGGRAWKLS